jgi:hypothetical protein
MSLSKFPFFRSFKEILALFPRTRSRSRLVYGSSWGSFHGDLTCSALFLKSKTNCCSWWWQLSVLANDCVGCNGDLTLACMLMHACLMIGHLNPMRSASDRLCHWEYLQPLSFTASFLLLSSEDGEENMERLERPTCT